MFQLSQSYVNSEVTHTNMGMSCVSLMAVFIMATTCSLVITSCSQTKAETKSTSDYISKEHKHACSNRLPSHIKANQNYSV